MSKIYFGSAVLVKNKENFYYGVGGRVTHAETKDGVEHYFIRLGVLMEDHIGSVVIPTLNNLTESQNLSKSFIKDDLLVVSSSKISKEDFLAIK